MYIKKGDKVIVIAGKDKGKTGVIMTALPNSDQVIIDSVNMRKKHTKAKKADQKSELVELATPNHVSNVMLVDSEGKRTRVGKGEVKGKKVRIAKTTGKEI